MSQTTTLLMHLAENHSRAVLTILHEALMPTWVLIGADKKVSVIATPWKDNQDKQLCARKMKQEMRRRRITAYSFVTEAWASTVSAGADLSKICVSDQPDKTEIVVAMASDGADQEFKTWTIQRDWNEQVTTLVPRPNDGWSPEGWMFNMLKKSRG